MTLASLTARPICVSLFSGCGGMDIGVEAAGFRIVVATDADETCAQTYKRNFPRVPFVVGNIGSISAAQLMEAAGVRRGEVDLLVGGAAMPCIFEKPLLQNR